MVAVRGLLVGVILGASSGAALGLIAGTSLERLVAASLVALLVVQLALDELDSGEEAAPRPCACIVSWSETFTDGGAACRACGGLVVDSPAARRRCDEWA